MSASWPMGICMAMVVIGCARQKPAFSLDRVSAGEAGVRRSGAPQSHPEWRDRFDVNKADLLPTGTNAYITMQPGRVLKLKHGNDTLAVTVLSETGNDTVKTQTGTFEHCVHLHETTPLERGCQSQVLRTWHRHHQGR